MQRKIKRVQERKREGESKKGRKSEIETRTQIMCFLTHFRYERFIRMHFPIVHLCSEYTRVVVFGGAAIGSRHRWRAR